MSSMDDLMDKMDDMFSDKPSPFIISNSKPWDKVERRLKPR